MNDMNEETEPEKIEMSELEKAYFKLTFLRDEFNKQIKKLEEQNKTLDNRVKGFVAHIDEIGKASDKIQQKVEQNLNHLLNTVAEKTADRLAEKSQENVDKTLQELNDGVRETTRTLNNARSHMTMNTIWWHLGIGAGSVLSAVIVFFILHVFINNRTPTITLTDDVHARLALGDQFNKFLEKLSKKQRQAVSDIFFIGKKPSEVFSKEYKE